ncbi:MAG: hypothetical protein ACW98F_14120 [Candidatus Hodarchaeales archaeon]|jgi:aminobenzoyl-glutamate utilization protein B
MKIGHKGMLYAANVLALATEELLMNSELVRKVKQEFQKKIGETPYKSLLPKLSSPPLNTFVRFMIIHKIGRIKAQN